MLFGQKYRNRLPEKQEPAHDPQLRQRDAAAKAKQKHYKDAKSNVRPHNIQSGDQVLLLQRQTKSQSRYDPNPYTVTDVQGTQITAIRKDKIRKRDAKKFKKVKLKAPHNYAATRHPRILYHHEDEDYEYNLEASQTNPNNHLATPNPTYPIPHSITQPAPERLTITTVPGAHKVYHYPNKHLIVDTTLNRQNRVRHQPQRYQP